MNIALPVHLTEKEFIRACVREERWAQQLLYEEYYSPMMAICLRYANNQDDALDMLHEGFIKVFRNISKYQAGTSLGAWIRRVMVNTCIDHYRKLVRRRTEDIEEAYHLSSLDPDAVSNCSTQEILDAVQTLSPAYRTVFNLYVIDGYPHKEIAEMLMITESTSRSNLVKARAKLQEILKDRGAYER
jgi:RNA polymerase sigma factor (sigma-70 family)